MNKLQIFENPTLGNVRIVTTENNEPLFCLTDVCQALDLRAGHVKERLSKDVVSTEPLMTAGGIQQVSFVNEDGLYDVILDSRKPEAKAFRKWITSEVLPSIRKDGGYILAQEDDTPEIIMARAILVAQKTIENQKTQLEQKERLIEEQTPKVAFANAMIGATNSILVGELAKLLNKNGINIGQNRLFEWMRENNYLCSCGEKYNQPTQYACDLKIIEKASNVVSIRGSLVNVFTPKVTPKGISYFVKKFIPTEKLVPA